MYNNKKIWGWMSYDWASQPYHTLLTTFIFAPYFTSTIADTPVHGQALWAWSIAIAGLVIAILAPILGAYADTTGPRKPWILLFSVLMVIGAFGLWGAKPGMANIYLPLIYYSIAIMGLEFATTFNNAMLPALVPRDEIGVIGGKAWGLGYLGGLVALAIMLLFFAENDTGKTMLGIDPIFGLDASTREGTRVVGPFVAIWYIIFIIPLFLWVPDVQPKNLDRTTTTRRAAFKTSLSDLKQTLINLPKRPAMFSYLMSSMIYRDALNGLYAFGGIYAAGVLGWSITSVGVFGIIAAAFGAVSAWLGGYVDRTLGPRVVIVTSIWMLILVCIITVATSRTTMFGFELPTGSSLPDISFYICGVLIGIGGGALQSASRTMLIHTAEDKNRMTEAFGLYALSGKATAFIAPALIGFATYMTGSQRLGISPVILLFVIGLYLLRWTKNKAN